ncbi:hypothetical protein JIN85_18490 [Luteolibacter pohnpeiensis]|uniref:Uncharacterized protein n=1 Tax=Luteolibacter pohnpeiensis TaxID=454153 RepID=A0A934SE19_9BACT|nr:hypothetical protein [Luteolibacter pohnpeiensis]MBK1884412.1 hypothetical protein [Luteolibacter pohnpeiensis]
MPSSASQTFLRELDKKLWTAADKLRPNLDADTLLPKLLSGEKTTAAALDQNHE